MNSDSDFLIANSSQIHNDNRIYNTLEQAPTTQAKKFPQYISAIAATLSAFAAGIVLGWTSPIELALENKQFHNISIDHSQMGWIGSLSTLGALVTCIPTGFVCDLIGRKSTLIIIFFPYAAGWALIISAKNLIMLYLGRFIMGVAAGACCIAAPMYCSEIGQKEIRGTLGSYFQLMVTIGILYAYLFGAILTLNNYTIVCSLIPCVFVIIFAFQPESPMYYLKKMKYDEAKLAMKSLRGANYNVDAEFNELEAVVKQSHQTFSLVAAFHRKANKKAIFISMSLMFFQQFSGINAVIFYTNDIFAHAEVTLDPKLATIIVGVSQVIATFISSLIVDKLGRKMLLIGSAACMSLSLFMLGLFFALKEHHIVSETTIKTLGFLPVVSLMVYIIVFSLGFGPIPWVISGEIFSPEIKSIASSISGCFNWFLAFLITKMYLEVYPRIGQDNIFFIFGFIMIIAAVFVHFVLPETKGKTLAEIQEALE